MKPCTLILSFAIAAALLTASRAFSQTPAPQAGEGFHSLALKEDDSVVDWGRASSIAWPSSGRPFRSFLPKRACVTNASSDRGQFFRQKQR